MRKKIIRNGTSDHFVLPTTIVVNKILFSFNSFKYISVHKSIKCKLSLHFNYFYIITHTHKNHTKKICNTMVSKLCHSELHPIDRK